MRISVAVHWDKMKVIGLATGRGTGRLTAARQVLDVV